MGRVKDSLIDQMTQDQPEPMDTNPFTIPPEPIPFNFGEDEDLYGPFDPFGEREISAQVALNSEWLHSLSPTTAQVRIELFPHYRSTGMSMNGLLVRISRALHDAGYKPSNHGANPTWTFPLPD